MGKIDGMQERGLGVGGKSTGTRIGRSSCFSVIASPEHPMGVKMKDREYNRLSQSIPAEASSVKDHHRNLEYRSIED